MSIDWSLAPSDAQYGGIYKDRFSCWYLLDGDQWYYTSNISGAWEKVVDNKPSSTLIARPNPKSWSGEKDGFPPIGVTCERRFPEVEGSSWRPVTICFIGEQKIFYRDEAGDEWANLPDDVEFRPIRTPEQLAAEERENELNRMVATVSMLDKGWARKVCAGLYDAGYRKQ